MDRSVDRLPHPVAGAPKRERRRCVRQKLHTPVYATFNGPQTGVTVDLSELLDLHEEGFAVQTSERLEANRAVSICLDLPETRSFIHGSGQVIWSDETGRGGIRFSQLAEGSRRVLQEWLFANLLIASSNHQARTEQRARHAEEHAETDEKLSVLATTPEPSNLIPIFDRTERVSPLEAVRREVREIEDDVDEVLHLITERSLSLTGATGAALASLTDDKMICRARAGDPAPPLGAAVDVKQGLSGECVRSGLLVSCDDMENDARVHPEIGRALGIGSLMASPIVSDFRVVGLLEVFSPHPHSFTRSHATVLERLVEMVPKVPEGRTLPENAPAQIQSLTASAEASTVAEPVLPPPISAVDAVEPSTTGPAAMELDSLHAVREALWDLEPRVPKKAAQPASEPVASEREPLAEPTPEPAPAAPARLLYRALLGLVFAVVVVAVGYVLAPVVERRWPSSSPTSRASPVSEIELSSSLARPGASDRRSVDQRSVEARAQVRSVAELQNIAEQGDADAQWQMAVRYHNGEGVPQDDTQAMKWFERAAEQGHIDAQSRLGAYYWAGRGVPEDLSKAYYWSAIATAQGDEISKSRLEGLTYQMTRAQISSARQQAEAWLHNHSQRPRSEAN